MKITGKTRIFTILAHPSSHVAAPVIYNSIFDGLGLDMAYIAHDILPGALEAAIQSFRSWENLGGFNVTVPHKEAVAGLVDRKLPPADSIGAVNTVVRSPEGSLSGYNTDGMGALRAIGGAAGAECLVIGAGGAARAIVDALLKDGARYVSLLNRTPERARSVMKLFPPDKVGMSVPERLPGTDIVVQATPVADEVPFGLDLGSLKKGTRVLETVMRETALGREASRKGLSLIPGHAMLFHQTRENFLLMTGTHAPDTLVQKAFQSLGYITP